MWMFSSDLTQRPLIACIGLFGGFWNTEKKPLKWGIWENKNLTIEEETIVEFVVIKYPVS